MSVRPPLFTRGGADTDTQTEITEKQMKTPPSRKLPAGLQTATIAFAATRNHHGQIELSIRHSPITFVLEHHDALELADAIVDATEQRRKRRRRRRHPTTHANPEIS